MVQHKAVLKYYKIDFLKINLKNFSETGNIKMPAWKGRKPNDVKYDILLAVITAFTEDKSENIMIVGQVLFKYLGKEQYQEKLALSTFAVGETIVRQDLGMSSK
ncbi:MAG: hypothetical protein AAF757_02865 [Cyanobacteria bacterium P01_D01_bin.116]